MKKRLVTAQELSEVINVKISWVRGKARKGEIPYYKAGKYYRFDVDEVLESMANKNGGHEGEVVEVDFPRSPKLVNPRRDIALSK